MDKRKVQRLRGIAGIVLMILFLAVIYFWESIGREKLLYESVLVVNKDVNKGDVITKETLGYMKTEETKFIKDAIRDPKEVLGKQATHFIPAKAQIHKTYIDDGVITTKKDELIFRIPNDWLVAIPSSIRRKDEIILYSINEDNLNAKVNISYEKENTEEKDKENINLYVNREQVEQLPGTKVINTTVAFVKDSANREVVDVGDKERINGSSQVNSLEIIATSEQIEKLKEYKNKGNKFLVMFKEKR